ncbi:cyclic nucleotide-binding domain-containing protein [Acetobacterium fimetarium]|uniref:Cyclic nucleotide-binding domain-containing protein n=1 Tax=Acetobacterium fimetarium TaxID=52691 RepID=A0ABR6WTB5_9FIRM|nr:Crp/Fnr family transcriptional regulator [Acetobacterium fimetarium]MBC3803461.1 cyclic nucleotide-binding domain-containing protein [Acetobacterium fimetarium]
MNNNVEILRKVKLFDAIDDKLEDMLQCLGSEEKKYDRGEIILMTGQPVTSVGVVLSGEVQIIQEDYYGNRSILTELKPGHIFGEAFASAGIKESPVTILAKSNCRIMFLAIERIISTCPNSCIFHSQLMENLLKILARKNILLSSKNQLLSQRTIRDKVLSYLGLQAEKKGSLEFEIPFSRNELADFLCVDRSALSRVLSQLKKDGTIEYQNQHFRLL